MPDLVLRLATASWNGLPIVSLAFFAFGGLMYLAMSRSPPPPPRSIRRRIDRPGWIARRRARAGIKHRRDRVGVGFTSATRSVYLTPKELAGHGLFVGGPGSGKTTALQLLIEASAGRMPVVVLDPKGSPALEATVRAHGGQVWTLDGTLPADLLDTRPWQVPDLLLEAEEFEGEARVFRDAAHQRALWAAWSLVLDGRPMDLAELRRRLDRGLLSNTLERHRGRDSRIADWLTRLSRYDRVAESGAADLDRALGTLLDGVALRGSLRCCPEALRLEDVMDTNGLVLFKLDAAEYPHATRKIAAWVQLAMARLARHLPAPTDGQPSALLLVDEVGALGSAARHLRGLVGRARESGLAVVLATQGLSDLHAVEPTLVDQVLQDTAFQLVFRQGSPHDARLVEALFGQHWVEDATRYSDGRSAYRHVERPRVPIDEWLNGLEPGDAWLRVAPVDGHWRQERVRVALPSNTEMRFRFRSTVSVNGSVSKPGVDRPALTEPDVTETGAPATPGFGGAGQASALPRVPPDCPAELLARMGADMLAKLERRWSRKHHDLGPCLACRDDVPRGPDAVKGPYGRMYDPALGKTDYIHLIVWRRCYPDRPIPKGWTIDHLCEVGLCGRPDHLDPRPVTHAENTRRRHERARSTTEAVRTTKAARGFAVALFAGIDKPTVQPRTVSLDELAEMLGRFEVLEDKRRGGCWSPTKYADGASSRGNAGVASVSCLVFDLDRVPPDPKRLEHVCWIGHTTHSHTLLAPRWRVVVPLARPVLAKRWAEVWCRARAALCPEADPACKDPSRAYWLPSHPAAGEHDVQRHDGPLLDVRTLPELPPEERTISRRRPRRLAQHASQELRNRDQAYMRQVLDNLATTPAGGRNAALNHAAWTLGHWVAAGVLEQREVEDALYAAAERNGLVADDGERQCWATIRSGLSAGLQRPIELRADR